MHLARPSRAIVAAILLLTAAGCSAHRGHHPLTLATLYAQSSAESAANCRGVYAAARLQRDAAIADTSWTAALEQEGDFAAKPPAIVLDVDETVLDNSPYEVRLIEDRIAYPAGWEAWCNQAAAEPVAGALELTRYAAERGVTVFYLTNREARLEAGTRRNLVAEGFPVAEDRDVVLMANEREEWTSDKTTRRRAIAETHRIVMLFGDNMGDFVARDDARGTPAERAAVMKQHADRWGTRWFMLPNAMYGYWDGAVLGDDYDRSESVGDGLRLDGLDARR